MITFKIAGKKYELPTRWEDVTYRQYVALMRTSRLSEHISVFTGIPVKTIEEAEIKGLEKITISLSFLSFSPHFKRTKMVGRYIMPDDVTMQSTGQMEGMKALFTRLPAEGSDPIDAGESIADIYLEACAIYCQKMRDGKFDMAQVPSVKEELSGFSAAQVLGTGGFFFYRSLNLSPPTTPLFRRFFQRLKKWSQALPGYRKTSDLLARYTGSAVK